MLSADQDSFPIWILFISFSCLIALPRASSIVFSWCGESEHPFLIFELKGKDFKLSLLSMMLAVRLSYKTFIMLLRGFFFLSSKDVEFCEMFFLHLLRLSWFLKSFC